MKNKDSGFLRFAGTTLFVLLFSLLLCEGAARTYLHVKDGIPFFASAARHSYRRYQGLKMFDDETTPAKGTVEVLLLGASSLKNTLYDVGTVVEAMLRANPKLKGKKIRVYDLAVEAQMSLDSYYKYRAAAGKRDFSFVVVYDGINDLRANNCPRKTFRNDYSHFKWYDEMNYMRRHETLARTGLYFPYFLYVVKRRLAERFGKIVYMPPEKPRADWFPYGADIKTAGPFRKNMEDIVRVAAAHHQKVILTTFAHYIPPDYSFDKWKKGNYGKTMVFPVEMWGEPEAIEKGLAAHNRIIREIAAENPRTAILLDEDRNFPKKPEMFIDVCHMTPKGVSYLAWDISRKIAESVGE